MPVKVAIEKCADYDQARVLDAMRNLVDKLGGIPAFIKPGQRVLLKPNLLVGRSVERPVCTHPSMVAAAALLVKEAGALPFIGDSPSIGTARAVAKKCGIQEVADELGIEVVNFTEPVELDNPHSQRYRKIWLAREVVSADAVINLSRIKTHALLLVTMAVKNMFGCVVGLGKTQWHLRAAHNIETFAEMLLSVYKLSRPVLSFADGIVGMDGNGPSGGDPKPMGIIIASPDAVAIDRVIGEIIGLKLEYNLTASLGGRLKLGEADLKQIQILGPALSEIRVQDFKFPHAGPPKDQHLPRPLDKIPGLETMLGDAAITRPEINEDPCTRCGTCIKTCPAEAMSLAKRGNEEYVLINRKTCIHCFCCQEVCPENAIRAETGWLAKIMAWAGARK